MAKKSRKSKFKGKVSVNAQKQKSAARNYGYLNLPSDVEVFKPTPGTRNVRLDFIPYIVSDDNHPDKDAELGIAVKDDIWYRRPFMIHRNVGSGDDSVVCLQSIGKKCPICEYAKKRKNEGADKEELQALRASKRAMYVVIPLNQKDYEKKPYVWDMSHYLFQALLNDELEEDPDSEVFPDLEEGLTLKIRFDSSQIGKSKPFAEANRIDFIERDSQYTEDVLDTSPKLDELLTILSFEELEGKFFEMEDVETTDDEEDEKPFDADEEPEEEDEKPTRKRKSAKAKPEPEDEEPKEGEEPMVDPIMNVVEVGDFIEWKYRGKMLTGEVTEVNEDSVKVTRDDNGRKTVVDAGDFALVEPPFDADEEPEDEEPHMNDKKPARRKSKSAEQECPSGHTFGVDTDEFDECDECPLWDACSDKLEENE
jgi:hypothetical protein